ncbi:MAG: arsenate reductase [Gammaproteobacteria bacterium]|nr:arsenate reductase [Gammaproteobacteria bacterium]NVK87350.1 arsenate reductase [Gammaproteobacteria bacterium]
MKIYGIKNCDTMKKAFKFFAQHQLDYEFIDYKKQGIDAQLAAKFIKAIPLQTLINQRGTTWRKLDDATKENLNQETAATLMMEHTSIVKRPIIEFNQQYEVGFNSERYEELFL